MGRELQCNPNERTTRYAGVVALQDTEMGMLKGSIEE